MKDPEESSSNDEATGEGVAEEGAAAAASTAKNEVPGLLLDVVERLTKIAVLCESPSTADAASTKSLVKHMYKFEKALRKLQGITEQGHDGTDTVFKGAVRAVDNYVNPYDWAYANIIEKYRAAGSKLDASLDAVDELQKQLIERLQVNSLLEQPKEGAE